MSENSFNQSTRAILVLFYIAIIVIVNYILFGQWLPPISGKGLWFYTGIASLLLSNFLVTPHYIKPVDAISFSVVSLIAIYTLNDFPNWTIYVKSFFILNISFYFFILLVSFSQILTKNSNSEKIQKWSNTFKLFSENFGNHNIVFSSLIIFSLIVFHIKSPIELLSIIFVWLFLIIFEPDKFFYQIWCKVLEIWSKLSSVPVNGKIEAVQSPNILLISPNDNYIKKGSLLLAKNTNHYATFGVALDYLGFGTSRYLRAYEFEIPERYKVRAFNSAKRLPDNRVALFSRVLDSDDDLPILTNMKDFIGLVSSDSSIERLFFEVLVEEDIEAGCLIKVFLKNYFVYFQVLDGLTKEDIIYQKTKHGFARAQAQQVGIWLEDEEKFKPASWIPKINSLVYIVKSDIFELNANNIGHFPNSNFTVNIKDINHLVTHNTAVLGILGVGKSMLSIELVERMISNDIKVICFDLTNQYASELSDFYDIDSENQIIKKMQDVGINGKSNFKKNVEEGGSINEFSDLVKQEIVSFLNPDNPKMLGIFNPSAFEVWRQDSKPFQDKASMASLTPTEITQIFSEMILEVSQEMGMTDTARICLVYEEAHSLVPEWNSVANDGDKTATSGTARAILQGRKFGLGCLLITQRTANVTKTILNQCNTIFAMRTFDDTGKAFLSNYLGNTYADLLPSLQERQAIFFGRASSCENPILVRLNDRDKFLDVFRKEYPPPKLEQVSEEKAVEINEDEPNTNEDLEF